MMPDLPTMLVTALKGILALSALGGAAILCWLSWLTRCIQAQDARDWQAARLDMYLRSGLPDVPEPELPSETTVEVCGEVFSAEEARWLAELRAIWHNATVEAR